MTKAAEIAIVFDGPPGSESGRFVEVEIDGRGVALGRWEKVDAFASPASDKVELVPRWELRFTLADAAGALAGAPGSAYLDHIYNGPAIRIHGPELEHPLGAETIAGAFAVLYRDERCAIIDNGEEPRGRWLVTILDRLVRP